MSSNHEDGPSQLLATDVRTAAVVQHPAALSRAGPIPRRRPIPHRRGRVGYAAPPVWVPPVPVYPYARWGRRVGAYLIDFAPAYVAMIPFWIGYVLFYVRVIQLTAGGPTGSSAGLFGELLRPALVWMIIGFVLMLIAFGWQWYNRWLIAGRTGQSMGKRVLKTKLVAEVNGQPIGAVNAFLRDLLHILDGIAYIGFLWPLWDAKRQTFADMIMKTVVVDHPPQGGPPQASPPSTGPLPVRSDGMIAITGATGALGSRVARLLADRGHPLAAAGPRRRPSAPGGGRDRDHLRLHRRRRRPRRTEAAATRCCWSAPASPPTGSPSTAP